MNEPKELLSENRISSLEIKNLICKGQNHYYNIWIATKKSIFGVPVYILMSENKQTNHHLS